MTETFSFRYKVFKLSFRICFRKAEANGLAHFTSPKPDKCLRACLLINY